MRSYSILVASSEKELETAARGVWTILQNTVRQFSSLMTNDDQKLGNIGQVRVRGEGWVALAYRDE